MTEDIEYLLLKLKEINEEDFNKYSNEYYDFLNNENFKGIDRQNCITYLASLAGKIQASLIINKKSNNSKIIEYLEKLKIDYLNKFIFDSKDETGITLEELYEIINNIFNKSEEFDVFKQRIIRRDLGFIYLNVFKENLENHSLSVDHVYNTYFKEFIKTIVVIIDSLKELGLIESLSEDFNLDNELKVEEVLEVINNIKFVKFNINETRNIKEIAKKI